MRGSVQGVGFRWFALRAAEGLGLRGWIRNRPDGAVEGEAEGPQDALREFVAQLNQGPASARVDAVETRPVKATGGESFEVR